VTGLNSSRVVAKNIGDYRFSLQLSNAVASINLVPRFGLTSLLDIGVDECGWMLMSHLLLLLPSLKLTVFLSFLSLIQTLLLCRGGNYTNGSFLSLLAWRGSIYPFPQLLVRQATIPMQRHNMYAVCTGAFSPRSSQQDTNVSITNESG
jgi:hypothetical protein